MVELRTGLGVELWELFIDPEKETISGTLEYRGKLYTIRSRKDLEELLTKIE